MPDLSAISALVSSFKAASDITRGFMDLKTMAEVQTKVIELQSVIMAAQGAAMSAHADLISAQQQIEALEKELASLRGWEAEKNRYRLTAIDKEVFAYVVKPEVQNGEPLHWLCANCFVQDQKSILQLISEGNGLRRYQCPRCKTELETGQWNPPPIQTYHNPYA